MASPWPSRCRTTSSSSACTRRAVADISSKQIHRPRPRWASATARLVAEEIHIFPEDMPATGEGHRDWDKPNSKMTNANVADIVGMGKDHVMTVKYKGGREESARDAADRGGVVCAGEQAELKPGAPVFINAERRADGTLAAPRVNVGMNGQVPPM